MKELVENSQTNLEHNEQPSYTLLDSQSVKITDKAEDREIDEKIKGRKRQIVTDTQGHLLHI